MVNLLALLMLANAPTAEASDIGTDKKFGIGAHLGSSATITGKYYLSEKNGLAFHVGTWYFWSIHARVQFESEFVEFADWDFGRLDMYWNAGVSFNQGFFYAGTDIGVGGGVGVELQFHNFPLQVFIEADLHIQPTGFIPGFGYSWYSYYAGPGARWYF